ncbi:hypothetical protein [Myxacorys almedinensis]|uniref:Uncharacterized protein n=1 Tax=Myxacorys almedinensis A TaxID=2690445 RepID=A0A8J7Z0N3_9CYAN|nr:hypothetical protein [Myxacorys almedinensis]NDJ16945.1 hypothetical protein [Myxacorys almedinensis A]
MKDCETTADTSVPTLPGCLSVIDYDLLRLKSTAIASSASSWAGLPW